MGSIEGCRQRLGGKGGCGSTGDGCRSSRRIRFGSYMNWRVRGRPRGGRSRGSYGWVGNCRLIRG